MFIHQYKNDIASVAKDFKVYNEELSGYINNFIEEANDIVSKCLYTCACYIK